MRRMKKFSSIILAATMVASMSFPAMAATITIEEPVRGKTYNAYKIFDYTTTGTGDSTGYSYKMDATTYATWGTYIDEWSYEGDDIFSCTEVEEGGVSTYYFTADAVFRGDDSAIAKAFAAYLKENESKGIARDSGSLALDAEENIIELSVDDNGYYFIDTEVGSLVNLTMVGNSATINEKTSLPEVTSKVIVLGENNEVVISSNSVGKTIDFAITVQVNPGNDDVITIHDAMGDGLDLVEGSIKLKDVAVPAYDSEEDQNFYLNSSVSDGCDFEIVLTQDYVKTLSAQDNGETLTITYSAVVTSKIDTGNVNGKNKAWVTYKDITIPGEETNTYAASFSIHKIAEGSHNLLAGAKFRLYDAATDGNEIVLTQGSNLNEWIVDASADAVSGDPIVTNDTNNITIKGLAAGDYWLEEVEAPAGYNLLTERIPLRIAEFDADPDTQNDGKLLVWQIDGGNGQFVVTKDNVVTVENSSGATLPSTGGIGTTIFYAAGIVLMAGTVFFIVRRKRA